MIIFSSSSHGSSGPRLIKANVSHIKSCSHHNPGHTTDNSLLNLFPKTPRRSEPAAGPRWCAVLSCIKPSRLRQLQSMAVLRWPGVQQFAFASGNNL